MVPLLLLLLLQPPTRWPIESLAVEGNGIYSEAEVLGAAGLKRGQLAGKEELESARARLMATGYFGSAGYRFKPSASGKGIAATLEISEIAEVYPIGFERLNASPEELLARLKKSDLLFRDNIPASRQVLERFAKEIESLLASQGDKTAVSGKLLADRQNRMRVVFSPSAPPPVVAEVRFSGNAVLPAAALQSAIAPVAVGAPYTESGFRDFLDASIRPLYEARGRIRVAFPKIETEKAQQVEGLTVSVDVAEGEVYNLGRVRLAGEDLPEQELRKVAGFRTGGIADFSEIAAAIDRIKSRVRRSGYLKVETGSERLIDDEKRIVDLVVSVEPGPRYQFGRLTLQGLDLDSEAEMKRLWTLMPGAPYDIEYPDYFLQRVREDGVFDNLGKTKAQVRIDDASRTVDVTLVFTGAPRPPRRRD
ncbi:MAG TPA: POTRA domain-containing protein [Bryobacteraceae bacterium]|nr:POTRA domain-containing protein [Bryobacteraceae bacterium]